MLRWRSKVSPVPVVFNACKSQIKWCPPYIIPTSRYVLTLMSNASQSSIESVPFSFPQKLLRIRICEKTSSIFVNIRFVNEYDIPLFPISDSLELYYEVFYQWADSLLQKEQQLKFVENDLQTISRPKYHRDNTCRLFEYIYYIYSCNITSTQYTVCIRIRIRIYMHTNQRTGSYEIRQGQGLGLQSVCLYLVRNNSPMCWMLSNIFPYFHV